MSLKSAIGNRSLGWDLLPPGSPAYEYKDPKDGKTYVYAGYDESPDPWEKGTEPKPVCMPRATVIAYTNWTLRGNPFSKKTPTLQLLSDSSPHSADKRHLITKPCNRLRLWVKQTWLKGLRSNAESFRRWLSKIHPKMPLPRFTGREWSWQRLTTDRLWRSVRSHFLSSSFICFQQFIK